jgi:hypothetical protein
MMKQASAVSCEARRYEIRLGTHLAPRWATWFDGMTLARAADGTTVLTGPVADQAALHGLLAKVRDLGVPLVGVTQLDAERPGTASTRPGDASTSREA